MKQISYVASIILLVAVLSSSITTGFSARPTSPISPAISTELQVWFDGTPQLTFTYPTFYEFPVAAKTSPGLWITDIHWDFGDGSTLDIPFSTESFVSDVRYHAYSQPGSYNVTVTAYDNMGNSGSAQITVTWVNGPGTVFSFPVPTIMSSEATKLLALPAILGLIVKIQQMEVQFWARFARFWPIGLEL